MSAIDLDRTDRHPSRVGNVQRVSDRRDPVLWGGVERTGPLSMQQLVDFERDGFVVLENWLDEETVDRCLTALEEAGRTPTIARSERAVMEPDSSAVRSLFEVHRISTAYEDLVGDGRLAGVARQLLDDDVYVHQSRVNLKPAQHGRAFPWHSDFETWHVEDGMASMRAVSCSVALTDNEVWNGPLLLISGSHRRYVSFSGRTPEDNHRTSLREQEYGVPDLAALTELHDGGEIVTFAAPAGSVVFFDCNTMHGSPNNISPRSRTNAFVVYNAWSNRLEAPFGTDRPRPAYIADRAPTAPL